jgi:hypothetical protein
MRAAALLLIAAAAGTCQESNEFGVLSTVAPEAAHLGGIKFRVAFTGTSEYTPAVIILDNGVSSPSDQPCIAEELAAALPGLPSVPVYAPYGGRPDLIYVTNMVNGVQLGLLSEIDYLQKSCAGPPHNLKLPPMTFDRLIPAIELLRALARSYAGRGPLRVFWLASDFTPYDWRAQARSRPARGPVISNRVATGIVDYLAPALSSAAISLFPLVVMRSPEGAAAQEQLDTARQLAAATGGIAALATGRRGEGLRSLFLESTKLHLVRLAPVTHEDQPEDGELKLQSPDGGFARRFVYPARRPFERITPEQSAMRVVTFDAKMSLGTGCPDADLTGSYFHLSLPPGERSAATPLFVDIQYLRTNQPTLRQRLVLSRPGPLCIPISDDGPGNTFIVVAHDPATGWTGARRGKLSPRKN